LVLDGQLSIGRIFGSPVLDEVHLRLVGGAGLQGIELLGQVGHIGLLGQHIDGGLLMGGLLGQLEGSLLEALVFGSTDEHNAEVLLQGVGDLLVAGTLIVLLLGGGIAVELLLELLDQGAI